MTAALYNRVRETSTTTGTGIVVMAGAVAGFRAFADVLSLSERFHYLIESRAAPSEWEIGEGYLSGLGNTLNRSRVLDSSNSGALVNFSAGTKDVRLAIPAQALHQPGDNLLTNGGFRIWQRQLPDTLTSRTDATYGPDRSYVLTQTAAIGVHRSIGPTTSQYCARLTQSQATAQRMGLAQVVPAADMWALRGKPSIFQGVCRPSAAQAIRSALVAWTGTADAPAKDLANNWGSGTFTPGNFFAASNLTVIGTTAVTPVADNYTDYEVRGTVPSNATNLFVFSWTEGTAAQNFTLDFAEWGLYPGTERRQWLPRPEQAEQALCERFFEKSYQLDTPPGAAATTAGSIVHYSNLTSWPNVTFLSGVPFRVPKFKVPTVTFYSYTGTANRISTLGGDDRAGAITGHNSTNGYTPYNNSGGALAASGGGFFWHHTADSEL